MIQRYTIAWDIFMKSFVRRKDDDGVYVLASDVVNPDCVWGEGECIPDCPSCKRMDELITERHAGYLEGLRTAMDIVQAIKPAKYLGMGNNLIDHQEAWWRIKQALEKEQP